MITNKEKETIEKLMTGFKEADGIYPKWLEWALMKTSRTFRKKGIREPELVRICIEVMENRIKALQNALQEFKNENGIN
jgi:hypothetical protein